jgi:MarR family transcriptional regulator, transcriptional regulator for hemolysin
MDSVLEQHPGFLIYDTVRLFRRCFGARIQDLGLSEAQWRVLGTVNKFAGISQTQLAEQLDIGKAPLGALIDKLESAKLLQRTADPADRRIKRLHVTAGAEPITTAMRERYDQLETEFLAGLSGRAQSALPKQLQQVYRNLSGNDAPALVLLHLLTGTARLFARNFDIQLKELGFTRAQWAVFMAISQDQGIQQNTLARALHMQKAPLGVLLDELEKGDWIERRPHPTDRRARQVFLTAHCSAQKQALTESYQTMHEKSLLGVSEKHRQQLGECLQTIRNNLQSIAAAAEHSQRKMA